MKAVSDEQNSTITQRIFKTRGPIQISGQISGASKESASGEGGISLETQSFWSKVKIGDPSICWEWMAGKSSNGYGAFWISGVNFKAHRIAYFLATGDDPVDRLVCHRCDNPGCCNPAHLFAGSPSENVRDMDSKGRRNPLTGDNHPSRTNPENLMRGEDHGRAKLTAPQVLQIREIYAAGGITLKQLGAKFGVSRSAVHLIVNRRKWVHI